MPTCPRFLTSILLLFLPPTFAAAAVIEGSVGVTTGELPATARAELIAVVDRFEESRLRLAGRSGPEALAGAAVHGGRFRLEVPEDGLFQVRVSAPGYVPMVHMPLPVVGSEGTVELPPLVLLSDDPVTVEVRGAGGAPAAGAWVSAPVTATAASFWLRHASRGWAPRARLVLTGPDGRAVLPRLSDERLDIEVYAPEDATPVTQADVTADLKIVLGTTARQRYEITLRGAGAVAVVSIGKEKLPVGETDADGRVSFTASFTAREVVSFLRAGEAEQLARLEPGESRQVFEAAAPGLLTGRLVTADGRPLAGALVWPHWEPGAFTRTDTRGVYVLARPLQRHSFRVQGEAAGFVSQALEVRLEDAEPGQLPDLVLPAAATAAGRVVDAAGRGVAGVQIEAWALGREPVTRRPDPAQARSRAGADGSFELSGLRPDLTHQLRLAVPGYFPVEREVGGISPGGRREGLRLVLTMNRGAFGQVLDVEERPLRGVRVTLLPAGAGRGVPPVSATSDENGRFVFDAFPFPRVEILTHKEGFAPLRVPGVEIVAGEGAMDLGTLLLEPGVTVAGEVVTADGTALDGAQVWATERPVEGEREAWEALARHAPDAVSDGGRFEVSGLDRGQRVTLVVYREGYLPGAAREVEAPTSEPVQIVLEPEARVAGRVVDTALQPVAGAEVTLRPPERPEGVSKVPARNELETTRSTRSGADGSFEVASLPPGEYTLEVYAQGYQPSEAEGLTLAEGAVQDDIEVVLERGAALEGRVTTAGGDPVSGVRLTVDRPFTTSGADGDFHLEGITPGKRTVEAVHPHFDRVLREVTIEPGTNHLDVVFTNSHRLAGRVVDERGTPLPDAQVRVAIYTREGFFGEPRVLTDGDGRFHFPRLAEGGYRLEVEKDGYVTLEPWLAVELRDVDVEDLEVVLVPSARLAGLVLGVDFSELADVRVVAVSDDGRQRRGEVGYEGSYEVTDLAPGDWVVSASLEGGARQVEARVVVAPGEREVRRDLELERGFVLSGRVEHGGEPVAAALVDLVGADVVADRQVRTGHDGRFRFEALEAGGYRLSVSDARQSFIHNETLALDGDRELLVELVTGRLAGVVTADGDVVHNALVVLQQILPSGEDSSIFTVGTDSDGGFRFERLPVGRFRLRIRREGYAQYEEELEVGTDGGDVRSFHLERTAGLEVRVRLASGGVPSSAILKLLDEDGRAFLAEARLATAGVARFETAPAGTWRAVVSAPGAAAQEMTVQVPGEGIDVVLEDAGSLRVRVPGLFDSPQAATLTMLDAAGRPFEGSDTWGALQNAWRLTRGTVTVEGVPAGLWTLRVVDAEGRVRSGVVTTPGRSEVEVVLN